MSQRAAFMDASAELAGMLLGTLGPAPDISVADFIVRSKSRRHVVYPMAWTPEGVAIHQGEGCEGELFNGPGGCWHSRQHSKEQADMTQALVKAEAILSPAPIDFDAEQLAVIKESIARGTTDAELQLFVATCRRTGLDPFMRQIYPIKRWDSKEGKEVMAIQVGIDGMRLIADRTGKYAGQDATEYLDADGSWSEVWLGSGHPVAARAKVYRKDWDKPAVAICRWDSYAQTYMKNGEVKLMPNWANMPDVMLGKCAESLALRRAFPAEMSALAVAIDGDNAPYAPPPAWGDVPSPAMPEADYSAAIEGEVITHGATEPPAESGGVADQTPRVQAAASPPARAAAPLDDITAFWKAAKAIEVDGKKLGAPEVTARSEALFGKRPVDLNAAERQALIAALSAGPASATGGDGCSHGDPKYTPSGDFICGECGAFLDETTGAALQPA